jgi:hypothetical protein
MLYHYGVCIIPDAHKNAINVVFALRQDENPAESENIGQPLNASGSSEDPVTYWCGGQLYQTADLPLIQNLAANMPVPSSGWPVAGMSGSVTEQEALDAAAALQVTMRTAELPNFTSQLAQETLAAALIALGLQRVT